MVADLKYLLINYCAYVKDSLKEEATLAHMTYHVPPDDKGDELSDGDVAVNVRGPRRPRHPHPQLGVAEA